MQKSFLAAALLALGASQPSLAQFVDLKQLGEADNGNPTIAMTTATTPATTFGNSRASVLATEAGLSDTASVELLLRQIGERFPSLAKVAARPTIISCLFDVDKTSRDSLRTHTREPAYSRFGAPALECFNKFAEEMNAKFYDPQSHSIGFHLNFSGKPETVTARLKRCGHVEKADCFTVTDPTRVTCVADLDWDTVRSWGNWYEERQRSMQTTHRDRVSASTAFSCLNSLAGEMNAKLNVQLGYVDFQVPVLDRPEKVAARLNSCANVQKAQCREEPLGSFAGPEDSLTMRRMTESEYLLSYGRCIEPHGDFCGKSETERFRARYDAKQKRFIELTPLGNKKN